MPDKYREDKGKMSKDLSELVKKGESEEVEFKKSTAQLDRALKSVCGFLNHKGGKVYFGINKGKITTKEYMKINKSTSERTARNDIVDLVKMDILQKVGTTQATYYIFNIRQHSAIK